MACDFHTHHQREINALISVTTPRTGLLSSLEYHPWHLPQTAGELPEYFSENLLQCAALGEVGLDRLHPPELKIQRHYFKLLLETAKDSGKPVVLHCVRCFDEIFSMIKPYDLRFLWHGFRGKPETAERIWQKGGVISFHKDIVRRPELLQILRSPRGKFGFESDDDPECDVRKIIGECAHLSGNRDLERISDNCFEEFLYG